MRHKLLSSFLLIALAACDKSTTDATVDGPREPPPIQVTSTGDHTCALSTTGAAYCWGYNANGQLGNGDSQLVNATPVAVAGGLTFREIGVAEVDEFTCGLTVDGEAYCWGKNTDGQLGDGTSTRRLTPTRVAGGHVFASISVGHEHTCALTPEGTAYCWGKTVYGAFGDGFHGTRLAPAPAAPGMSFTSIVAGNDYTCGLQSDGAAFCWGRGAQGQLGNADTTSHDTPVAVAGGLSFSSLVAGASNVCGLLTGPTVGRLAYCWGEGRFGELGDGTKSVHTVPVAVSGNLRFVNLNAGYATMCGVIEDGRGYCWGANTGGSIGDGTHMDRSSPTLVVGDLNFRSISAGSGVTCGVTRANAVYCWGSNNDGELGDATTIDRTTPGPVHWR